MIGLSELGDSEVGASVGATVRGPNEVGLQDEGLHEVGHVLGLAVVGV